MAWSRTAVLLQAGVSSHTNWSQKARDSHGRALGKLYLHGSIALAGYPGGRLFAKSLVRHGRYMVPRAFGLTLWDGNHWATHALLLSNIAGFVGQVLTRHALTIWGAKVNGLIRAGQYWRLVTPIFLHGNIIHLLVNCNSLYTLGRALESVAGSQRTLAVYAIAAIAGNLASFWGSQAISLGASGAIFGLGSAIALFYYRNRELYGHQSEVVLRQLGRTLVINFLYSLTSSQIDNWGHAGGLLGGALAGWLLGPRLKLDKLPDGSVFLVDAPPLPLFRNGRQLVKRGRWGRGR